MTERIGKFLISILLAPVLLLVGAMCLCLIPVLPFAVLIDPKLLTINKKGEKK